MAQHLTIHPGEHLAEELQALGMSAAALAREIKVPTNRVTEIINGKRAITGDTALRLGHFFGTSSEFWLNLQSLYELRRAEQKAAKAIKVLPTLKRRKGREEGPPALWRNRAPARVLRRSNISGIGSASGQAGRR
jgi:addiction module HigA family antidote